MGALSTKVSSVRPAASMASEVLGCATTARPSLLAPGSEMGRATRANAKKSAPTSAAATAPVATEPLFQLDTTGDSSVRNSLQHAFSAGANPAAARLRRGTAFNKPLKSDQILAARSAEPADRKSVV